MKGRASTSATRTLRMASSVFVVVLVLVIVIGSSTVYAQASDRLGNVFAGGDLRQTNSRDGAAILSGKHMVPGDKAEGTVVIANDGTGDLSYALVQTLVDKPGRNGGSLARTLHLTILDVTGVGEARTVYDGVIGGLESAQLGSFAPGESRTFRFTVAFPGGGADDDSVMGSSLSVRYDWTATGAQAE